MSWLAVQAYPRPMQPGHAVDVDGLAAVQQAAPGIPRAVAGAAACFVLGAGATAIAVTSPQQPPSGILLAGWPIFAMAGGILLDQRRFEPVGRLLCGLSLIPVVMVVLAWAGAGSVGGPSSEVLRIIDITSAFLAVAVLIGVPLAAHPLERGGTGTAGILVAVAVAGAAAVAARLATLGAWPGAGAVQPVGWSAVIAATATIWAGIVRDARTSDRMPRRQVCCLMATCGLGGVTVLAGWRLLPAGPACYLTATCLALTAVAVCWLCLTSNFRPLDEHLLDLALAAAVAAGASIVALLVRQGAVWTNLPSPNISAAFAALLTAATGVPAALWARRSILVRRYGQGAISPADVAVITADLGTQADPRDLLGKAARMVASASGCRDARLVLGDELPEVPPGWVMHPLDVGGERVGVLTVQSGSAEGPEPRQDEVIARLIPTLALVARAVSLAVEAELARRDVARERDAERRRILADLHDGLGPVLAGMSMQVRAALRAAPSGDGGPHPGLAPGLLAGLAESLARSRTDLRRIVAGITPSALDGADLGTALEHLVESFRGPESDGPALALNLALQEPVSGDVQIAVYRCVAEGLTNALRHAQASSIEIRVTSVQSTVRVEVTDDGAGGRIVPGVGLSSLGARARGLGGQLMVGPGSPAGTRLCLELPHEEGVSP
jgi:signal transduction histidine kinase